MSGFVFQMLGCFCYYTSIVQGDPLESINCRPSGSTLNKIINQNAFIAVDCDEMLRVENSQQMKIHECKISEEMKDWNASELKILHENEIHHFCQGMTIE